MSAEKELRRLIAEFRACGTRWMTTDDLDKMLSLLDDALGEARDQGRQSGRQMEIDLQSETRWGDDW